jgi:antitoxin ParD1/3/4
VSDTKEYDILPVKGGCSNYQNLHFLHVLMIHGVLPVTNMPPAIFPRVKTRGNLNGVVLVTWNYAFFRKYSCEAAVWGYCLREAQRAKLRLHTAKQALPHPGYTKNKACTWCVIGVYLHHNTSIMKRQSISFTEPNDEWLTRQIDNKEYSSKSELVNDLIRQARNQQQQIDLIRLKIDRAEQSGFTTDSKSEILKQSKKRLNG